MPVITYIVALPLIGLVLGALLPPLFFARDRLSFALLTLAGFVIYWFPVAWMTAWATAGDLPESQRMTDAEYLETVLGAAGVFAACALGCSLLRWLIAGLIRLCRSGCRRPPNTP